MEEQRDEGEAGGADQYPALAVGPVVAEPVLPRPRCEPADERRRGPRERQPDEGSRPDAETARLLVAAVVLAAASSMRLRAAVAPSRRSRHGREPGA